MWTPLVRLRIVNALLEMDKWRASEDLDRRHRELRAGVTRGVDKAHGGNSRRRKGRSFVSEKLAALGRAKAPNKCPVCACAG